MTRASGGRELLDDRGNEILREALAVEFPRLSGDDLLLLAAEVNGTAHLIASVQWRNAGHRPSNSPEVSLSTLDGGVMIHLHSSPDSLCAQRCAAAREHHATLYRHRFLRPPHPTTDAMALWAKRHREHQQFMFDYWQELLLTR